MSADNPNTIKLRAACKRVDLDKRITMNTLHRLGYIGGDKAPCRIPCGKVAAFLVEMLNTDTGHRTSFCYLYLVDEHVGYILPFPYSYFIPHKPAEVFEYQDKHHVKAGL